ncbi:MAG: NAD-dependent epimerase/dehydratase family protein [Pseudomonadota bacterium]
MKFIVGGRGRLGQALARTWDADEVRSLARADYADWADAGGAARVRDFFAPWAGSGSTVFVASGVLDPALPAAEHQRVNVDLPAAILAGAGAHGLRVVTFGTVMECLLSQQNPYVRSKAALGRHVADLAAAGAPVAHVRVHTLFGGGAPSPFMFLGQMLAALQQRTPFAMTLGRQLREYHHIDDEARAIRLFDEAQVSGVVELSHGEPLSLAELARTVFSAFRADDLLRLGARPEPAEENFATVLARHPLLPEQAYRPALPAIVDYLKDCGVRPPE